MTKTHVRMSFWKKRCSVSKIILMVCVDNQIVNKLVKFCHPKVVEVYKSIGPFKIRPTDISKKMRNILCNLEYRKSVMKINGDEYY